MNRAVINYQDSFGEYDGDQQEPSGQWFDLDKATSFNEDTRWNGSNNISCATGSQWEHETL